MHWRRHRYYGGWISIRLTHWRRHRNRYRSRDRTLSSSCSTEYRSTAQSLIVAKHMHWISDESAKKFLAEGFWRFFFYRGFLGFGVSAATIVTLIGLFKDGMQTFATVWWREGTVWVLIGGLIWGAAAWLMLKLPTQIRDTICWILLIAVVGFLGWTLY